MDVSIISTYLEEIYYKLPKSSGDVVDYVNTKYLPYAFALVHYTLVALSLRQRTGLSSFLNNIQPRFCRGCSGKHHQTGFPD